MLIKKECTACGGTGGVVRELRVGDIVTPTDGSSMCSALHRILFKGTGAGFKPVRVLAIEGNMLAVVPAYWEDDGAKHNDLYGLSNHVSESSSYIWKGESYSLVSLICRDGFWIHAHVSHFREREV